MGWGARACQQGWKGCLLRAPPPSAPIPPPAPRAVLAARGVPALPLRLDARGADRLDDAPRLGCRSRRLPRVRSAAPGGATGGAPGAAAASGGCAGSAGGAAGSLRRCMRPCHGHGRRPPGPRRGAGACGSGPNSRQDIVAGSARARGERPGPATHPCFANGTWLMAVVVARRSSEAARALAHLRPLVAACRPSHIFLSGLLAARLGPFHFHVNMTGLRGQGPPGNAPFFPRHPFPAPKACMRAPTRCPSPLQHLSSIGFLALSSAPPAGLPVH